VRISGAGFELGVDQEREVMNKLMTSVKNFLVSEDGPTAVEYAVMLALIIVVCITAVTTIGTKANAKFQSAAAVL
jgi:pilus assembly protein Flp/PilA